VTHRDTEIVAALLRWLADRVGQEAFDLWFGEPDCLAWDGQQLVVRAASQFKLNHIRAQFREPILAAAHGVLGHVTEVAFKVCERCEPVASESASSSLADIAASNGPGEPGARPPLSRRRFNTLRTFVLGSGNMVAHKACEMVLNHPGEITPLFLYGPSGTGKTHLLEGVWSEIRRTRPVGNCVVYLSAEQFTSHFLDALKGSGLPNFRQKYRRADVLLLDDVQFFAGKRATITEVQNTVDEMLREGRQLVMAADRPPAQLAELGTALTTRLSSGMVCALQPGDREVRLAIARQMCTARKLEAPREVLEYIAEHMPGDARHLAGALHRLQATSLAHGRPIDLALAREALADLVRANQRAIRLDDVQRAVCEVLGMENAQLQSDVKAKSASHPRMLAMFLARRHTRAALSEIGEHFGRRSHTTVVAAQKKVAAWIAQHSSLTVNGRTWTVEQAIREIENRLQIG
jgi:chromosomal replication initiator protein